MDNKMTATKNTTLLVGIGGAGCNALTGIIEFDESHVDTMALDRDKKRVDEAIADYSFLVTDIEDLKIEKVISRYDSVYLVSGLGGGMGSEMTLVITEIVKEAGIEVSVFVYLPFESEGEYKRSKAEDALRNISEHTDRIYTCDNQTLYDKFGEGAALGDIFTAADKALSGMIATMIEKKSPLEWVNDAGLWVRWCDGQPDCSQRHKTPRVVELDISR